MGFADPELNRTLARFVRAIQGVLAEGLVSVILHGGVAFGDLAPGYGDLDFVVVLERDLSEQLCRQLTDLRKPLRAEESGIYDKMLEGAFLPQPLLKPGTTGTALWWGTSGERMWDGNRLGWFALQVIRQKGIVIWGEDVRREIPIATQKALIVEVWEACKDIKEHGRGGSLHSVDWLLAAARYLLWLRERRLASKSEAAKWGHAHARGPWRDLLPRAKQIRLNPHLADSAETRSWLDGLTAPIGEAASELEDELVKQGSRSPAGDAD